MYQLGPKLPFSIGGQRGQRFEIIRIDERASQELEAQAVEVRVYDHRGCYSTLMLESAFMLAIADGIYRVCGREPREQPLRVEVVLAPTPAAAAAAAPVLQVPSPTLTPEEEAIKRRMIEGK